MLDINIRGSNGDGQETDGRYVDGEKMVKVHPPEDDTELDLIVRNVINTPFNDLKYKYVLCFPSWILAD